MRKNVKIIVGVVVLILVLVVGSFVGLIINRTNDHKFGRYVSTEGPWGMTATWVSEDSASYLVCKKENDEPFANVTAYFQGVDGWQAYELNSIDRIVYLDIVKDGLNYQKLGRELMSQDRLALMDGGKCILQVRGVRPFFSDKVDITANEMYKELSDFDKKNQFDIEKYVSEYGKPKFSKII